MFLIFVNSDSPLRPERGCGVSVINKSYWGEALMPNEPNDEVSDTRDDAQTRLTTIKIINYSRAGKRTLATKSSPDTVVLKSQIVKWFAFAILHLLTCLPIGMALHKGEKR